MKFEYIARLLLLIVYLSLFFCDENIDFILLSFFLSFLIIDALRSKSFCKVFSRRALCFYLPVALFVYLAITLFYSSDITQGLRRIKLYGFLLLIILFPLVESRLNRKYVLNSFVFATYIATLYCFFLALSRYLKLGTFLVMDRYGVYHNILFSSFFTESVYIENIYFACFVTFSLMILINKVFSIDSLFSLKGLVLLFSILYFSIFLVLLQGMIMIVVMGISLISLIIIKVKNIKFSLFFISIAVFFVAWGLSTMDRKYNLEKLSVPFETTVQSGKWNSVNARISKWTCSLDVIKNNFVFGVGVGDAQNELMDSYQKRKFYLGYNEKFNSHNQYLTSWISGGIISLILFLSIIIYSFILSFKANDILLFLFSILFLLFAFTESIFERQKGIFFFVFFWSILVSKSTLLNKNISERTS